MFQLLSLALEGNGVGLPDPQSILPYLGLFSLVTLNPEAVQACRIPILHQPPLSILTNMQFVTAPTGTAPDSPNVARIFDVLALVNTNPPINESSIPLSSTDHDFQPRRYWRLPVKPEAVLAALIQRLPFARYAGDSKEIIFSLHIRDILSLQSRAQTVIIPTIMPLQDSGVGSREPSDGDGPSGDGGGAGGDHGGQHDGDSGPSEGAKKRHRNGNSGEPLRKSSCENVATDTGEDTAGEASEPQSCISSSWSFCA